MLGPLACCGLAAAHPCGWSQADAGPTVVSASSMAREIDRSRKALICSWRSAVYRHQPSGILFVPARAARSYPSDLEASPRPVRLALLAALTWSRSAEITDSLVDLLIAVVHKMDVRVERKVEGKLLEDLRRVRGKEGILFQMAEAAVAHPDETVRRALYPVVGEGTLEDLVREAKATQSAFRGRVRTVLRSSYTAHYRKMLPPLLAALAFRSNNRAYRPVDALGVLSRYVGRDRVRYYDAAERVPIQGVAPPEWRGAVADERGRAERIPYELCALIALCDAVRRREVWISGANRWRNPEEDLPQDFEENRDVHYGALSQPLDPADFVTGLKERLSGALAMLDRVLDEGTTGGVRITTRRGRPWISVPKVEKLPEPQNLGALKAEVERRWGTIDLLDVLKEAALLTGFAEEFPSVASREITDPGALKRRLLLVLFGLGTNVGIRQIVATGEHGETEAALRRVRRTRVNRDETSPGPPRSFFPVYAGVLYLTSTTSSTFSVGGLFSCSLLR